MIWTGDCSSDIGDVCEGAELVLVESEGVMGEIGRGTEIGGTCVTGDGGTCEYVRGDGADSPEAALDKVVILGGCEGVCEGGREVCDKATL